MESGGPAPLPTGLAPPLPPSLQLLMVLFSPWLLMALLLLLLLRLSHLCLLWLLLC